ncbi:hypothetical protein BJV78DRAFT_693694 [Lactifluus subvellereus]|nr:hypothetical protein BJV78DRAFT_693694 [Lactifluus subvellereus]
MIAIFFIPAGKALEWLDMISTGSLIRASIRPLAQTFLTVGAGFGLTKADPLPTDREATRGAAQVVTVLVQCEPGEGLASLDTVSSVLPHHSGIYSQNIGSLVPLTVVGLLYGVAGASMAWIIKRLFWVPHKFRYGVLTAGIWGNYGDIRMCAVLYTGKLSF